jgi:predicted MPP superfamily phosphohydrolase
VTPRKTLWLLSTLGLLLIQLPEWFHLPTRWLGIGFALKATGLLLNGPGFGAVTAVLGYAFARTLFGNLLSWVLTLVLLEPVVGWIQGPARRNGGQREMTRRAFLVGGSSAAGALAVGSYSHFYELRNVRVEQFRLWLPQLPPALEGLRVVLMADWHCGPLNRPHHLRPAMLLANQLRPDLVLLPGDFISRSGRYFSEAAELASMLRPGIPQGVLLSWGNHDYWHGLDPGRRWMPEAGCQILTNQALVLNRRRELEAHGKGLWIAGVDDLWAGRPRLQETLARLPNDEPRLVLCHNPDLAEEQGGVRVDLMLSGHTHGGQVRIPKVGAPILPSRYGQKYAAGWVQAPEYPVYVNCGLGSGGIPVRLGVPPEITVFELYRGPSVLHQRVRLT